LLDGCQPLLSIRHAFDDFADTLYYAIDITSYAADIIDAELMLPLPPMRLRRHCCCC